MNENQTGVLPVNPLNGKNMNKYLMEDILNDPLSEVLSYDEEEFTEIDSVEVYEND